MCSGQQSANDAGEYVSSVYQTSDTVRSVYSKVRLSPIDRASDLQNLEHNLLWSSHSDNKLAMSIMDEDVLASYQNL